MKRRPLQSGTAAVPDFIRAFFNGGTLHPLVFAFPYHECLRHFWAAWRAENPGARPPQGFGWIAEPAPALLNGAPYATALAEALEAVSRGERWAAKQRARA